MVGEGFARDSLLIRRMLLGVETAVVEEAGLDAVVAEAGLLGS